MSNATAARTIYIVTLDRQPKLTPYIGFTKFDVDHPDLARQRRVAFVYIWHGSLSKRGADGVGGSL